MSSWGIVYLSRAYDFIQIGTYCHAVVCFSVLCKLHFCCEPFLDKLLALCSFVPAASTKGQKLVFQRMRSWSSHATQSLGSIAGRGLKLGCSAVYVFYFLVSGLLLDYDQAQKVYVFPRVAEELSQCGISNCYTPARVKGHCFFPGAEQELHTRQNGSLRMCKCEVPP